MTQWHHCHQWVEFRGVIGTAKSVKIKFCVWSSVIDTTEAWFGRVIDTTESLWVAFSNLKRLISLKTQIRVKENYTLKGLWGPSIKNSDCKQKFLIEQCLDAAECTVCPIRLSLRVVSYVWKHCREWNSCSGESSSIKKSEVKFFWGYPFNLM
jgi:hypothetical protein